MIQLNNNNSQIDLNQTDRNFVNNIINKITLFGQLPYSIPIPMVVEIIKSSARWFYKYHSNATKQSYYFIKKEDIINYAGCNNFTHLGLTINPEIRVVKEIHQTNSKERGDITAAIFDSTKNNGDTYGTSINNNLYIIEAAVKTVEFRGMNSILGSHLPFDFSPNTNELFLKHAPVSDIILDVLRDNAIHTLYNDTWFERHVLGCTKRELKRLIAGHTFNLPGGVTLSADEICNNLEDIENVENLVKSAGGIGDIIMKR